MRKTGLLVTSAVLGALLAIGASLAVLADPARAAFPGANGRIVFAESTFLSQGEDGIKSINPSGMDLGTLLLARPSESLGSPAVARGATRVACARLEVGQDRSSTEIYKLNTSNRRTTRITRNEMFDGSPTWSPDGTRVAFVRGEVGRYGVLRNTDIFVRSADGTGPSTNLTDTPDRDEFAPAWSPDGGEIAFHNARERAGYDIFVLDLGTGRSRKLTDDGRTSPDYGPSWSPDGTRIVFESYTRGQGNEAYHGIYTVDASDGSAKRVVYEPGGPGYEEDEYLSSPDWGVKAQR